MDKPVIAFTAVSLKAPHGYIGFVEELPGVTSEGRTLDETRDNLQRMAAVVFDEERAQSAALLEGKDVTRESFLVPVPQLAGHAPACALALPAIEIAVRRRQSMRKPDALIAGG